MDIKTIFKYASMSPIFFFIGVGVFLSFDIIQPSMFKHIESYFVIMTMALLVGMAPVILITSALNNTLAKYKSGSKNSIYLAISLVVIFMISEIVYSYTSIQGMFLGQSVPTLKMIGIIFLPLTFSLYYFVNLFYEHDNKYETAMSQKANSEMLELINSREKIISEIKTTGRELFDMELFNNNDGP